MKEKDFIQKNQQKWRRFEVLSQSSSTDPEELSRLFVEITEDLSYAKTNYPKRSVRVYLNNLSQGVFNDLNKRNKRKSINFGKFWSYDLPLAMYKARWAMLTATIVFILTYLIGAYSTFQDPSFVRVILGDGYVDFTDQSIDEGNATAIYQLSPTDTMSARITVNNIMVTFLSFFMGIFLSVGSIFMLARMGVLVGAFISYFWIREVPGDHIINVFIHGTFELSGIIIATGAGIVLGNGMLFPGSLTRKDALVRSAKHSISIMIGLIPVFIVAGILEGYLTRMYQMDISLKILVVALSAFVILGYYIIYPLYRFWGFKELVKQDRPHIFKSKDKFELHKLRKSTEAFTDGMRLTRMAFSKLLIPFGISLLLLAGYAVFQFYNNQEFYESYISRIRINNLNPMDMETVPGWKMLFKTGFGYISNTPILSFFCVTFIVSLPAIFMAYFLSHFSVQEQEKKSTLFTYLVKQGWKVWLLVMASLSILWVGLDYNGEINPLSFIIFILLCPVVYYLLFPLTNPNIPSNKKFLGLGQYFNLLGFQSILTLVIFLFALLTMDFLSLLIPLRADAMGGGSNILVKLLMELVHWHIPMGDTDPVVFSSLVKQFAMLGFFSLLLPLTMAGYALLYYNGIEKKEARGLKKRLESFGKDNKMFEDQRVL